VASPVPATQQPSSIPPAEAPWNSSIITPEGKFIQGWQDRLPAEFEEDRGMLAQFGDLKSLARVMKDNMAAARQKTDGMVKVPGAEATPEEWTAFHKSIGVPERAADYGLKPPDKFPEGVGDDPKLREAFAQEAVKLGLTPKQALGLQEFQLRMVGEQARASRDAVAVALAQEKAELRATFGDAVERSVDLAQRVARTKGVDPAYFDPQSEKFWGVEALSLIARLGVDVGEGHLVPGAAVKNLSQAAWAKDVSTNPSNPMYAKFQAGDPEVVAQVNRGYRSGT